ncbi:MAG TPA: DUF1015 domain-containing protein [Ktedonobacteraceae bacterium]|nr:DUF1015 domain-containing protein [Ktedonobacteraceae bacterium]
MADVQPLRGFRYASEVVGDIAQVVTPPYDVISPEAQARYYERNPHNIIRLELGLDQPGDNELNNRYTRAARTFAEWRKSGVVRQEEQPAYYVYQQRFRAQGRDYTRTSLIARVRIEPWDARVVLPHERTMSKPKSDRLNIIRATATNLSPIMSMYDDPQGRIRRLLSNYVEQAEVQLSDEADEMHILHPIQDPQQIELIRDFFSERQLYIADGHHRYETALNYRNEILEQRKQLHPDDAANFVMMALIDLDDPGMVVEPTHRVLFNLAPEILNTLVPDRFADYFTVQQLPEQMQAKELLQKLEQAGHDTPSFIIHTAANNLLLSLNVAGKEQMAKSQHSEAWNGLDVAVAHTLVLEALLGVTPADITAGTHLRYIHEAQDALNEVSQGTAQVALLLNATRVRQICEVSDADDLMPQKSTYFYPKLITGLVMNPLW